VAEIRKNYAEYHEKYKEKREGDGGANWKPVPAEHLAELIYHKYIDVKVKVTFRIIDFGCGPDGLFESKLAELLQSRNGPGDVFALAVDVFGLPIAERLTKDGACPMDAQGESVTSFTCETLDCDYTTLASNPQLSKTDHTKFDAGVFCLALMASDALSKGLLVAAATVKPGGDIWIVIDIYKVGIGPCDAHSVRETKLSEWQTHFENETGFQVLKAFLYGSPKFVYVHLRNVDLAESGDLAVTLKDVTFKTLNQTSKSLPSTPASSQPEPQPASMSSTAAGKRKLME